LKKINLPVILLKGIVLLPYNTLKLEFDSKNIDNNIIDMSISFHDGYILIVSEYDKNNIPKVGVLAKIENNILLPNGNNRVDIKGLRRVKILEYLNLNKPNEPLESIVTDFEQYNLKEESIYVNKIKKELKNYIKTIPYISNEILTLIEKEDNLSKIIDLIVPTIISDKNIILQYLNENNSITRSQMLLKHIYNDNELFKIERKIDLKIKKELDDTQKDYLLRQKIKLIKEELGEVSIKDDEIDDLRNKANKLKCPSNVKNRIIQEINKYESIPNLSPELTITRDYIDWLLALPWQKTTKDNKDLNSVKKYLNQSHYGLEEVKDRIIEYLAVKQMSNNVKSPIICLVGPPGTGKTSLVYSIAKAINRNFVKMSVGGLKDEAEIVGHRKTYIGANPGRIISSIKKAKSNNPLFLIDEIDKINKDYKNDPTACLLDILDYEQNKHFSDNYIEEEFDLSKVMFILTANDIENIPSPLRDRLEIINIEGYTEIEKVDIAFKHLIPKILNETGLDEKFIEIDKNTIVKIIQNYTKESGVRELERQLNKIIRKVVTQIVINNIKINKIKIDNNVLEKYLGKEKYHFSKKAKNEIGVVNGLAYTIYGGDTLPIETNYYKGSGKLILTGSLGEVMQESANIALGYIKSNYKKYNINYDLLVNNDIHINVPEGAIKKEGPSAGIAITLCLISALTNKKIPSTLALTGEITLTGQVLAIGGLKEKSIGALRSGIKNIIIPYDNIKDLDKLPEEVKEKIEFKPVKSFEEIINFLG